MASYKYRKVTRKEVDGVVIEEVFETDGEEAKAKMAETDEAHSKLGEMSEKMKTFFNDMGDSFEKLFK